MRYSQYYNKKDDKIGHLWQGRFFSKLLSKDHLYEAVRYVENNPVNDIRKKNILLKVADYREYLQIENWRDYLKEKTYKNIEEEIKKNTKTGRPCGGESFIEKLEKILGRRLRALPEGRPRMKK